MISWAFSIAGAPAAHCSAAARVQAAKFSAALEMPGPSYINLNAYEKLLFEVILEVPRLKAVARAARWM